MWKRFDGERLFRKCYRGRCTFRRTAGTVSNDRRLTDAYKLRLSYLPRGIDERAPSAEPLVTAGNQSAGPTQKPPTLKRRDDTVRPALAKSAANGVTLTA